MKNKWILTGKIVSGARKAAYFTQLDWVQEQCRRKLGFEPFPGTLNVEIFEEDVPTLEALQEMEGINLIPPDTTFCAAKTLSVSIGAVAGAMIIPAAEVRIHEKNIVEVIAPFRLKDALDVKDGDWLTMVVKGHSRPEN